MDVYPRSESQGWIKQFIQWLWGKSEVKGLQLGHPFNLIDILAFYSFQEFGALFLCIPWPRRQEDLGMEAWIVAFSAHNIVRRKWRVPARNAPRPLLRSQPHLVNSGVEHFDILRLDEKRLHSFIKRLGSSHDV